MGKSEAAQREKKARSCMPSPLSLLGCTLGLALRPPRTWIWRCVATSQSLTALSSPPLTASRASGEKAAERTQLEWPCRVHWNFLEGSDQTFWGRRRGGELLEWGMEGS